MPDQHEAVCAKRIGEVQYVLSESARLPTHGVRIVDTGGAEAAQVRHQEPQSFTLQVVDHAIPGAQAVGKAVEQEHRQIAGSAVLFIFDLDETRAGRRA